MKNVANSAGLRRKSKTTKVKRETPFGRELIASAKDILGYQRGEIEAEAYTLPGPMDVRAIRDKTGMSQAQFAQAFALNRRTLQDWECKKGAPLGAVRAYLKVIDRNPALVIEALRA